MEGIKPRFEFRSFAQSFGMVERRFRELSALGGIRESAEIYIMSAGNNVNNTKIRDDKMDIKVYVQTLKGLEQWNPLMKGRFPMTAEFIGQEVFPALTVTPPKFQREVYTMAQYIDEIIKPHPELAAVSIFKRRFAFTVNECIAEIGEVFVNGARIMTANLESVDVEAILEGMKMTGLDQYENINYLQAIKRVIGMEGNPIQF